MRTTEQETTLDPQFAEDFCERYASAWESRDPDRLAALCTEDVVWTDPALREPLHGRDGVRRFATESFRMCPDFTVEHLGGPYIGQGAARILLAYRMSGTMTGPWVFQDMAPTGARFEVEGIDAFDMRDGLIDRYSTFWDTLGMLRQLGVMPAPGSSADRALTRMQHVQARFQRRPSR
jgi:steroid delta-isomerase-like uncharacterized protein